MSDQPTLPFDDPGTVDDRLDAVDDGLDGDDASGGFEPDTGPLVATPLEVRIVRSKRRKKSVGAHIVDGVVEVIVPTWMSKADAERHAEQMRVRFERRSGRSHTDLVERARTLAATYDLPKPLSVRWVTNQNNRWGSCTPADSTIRLSHRLKTMPRWVVDYVLVHELAHLRHPDHSPEFWAAVNRYPKSERARGFLIGVMYAENPEPTTV